MKDQLNELRLMLDRVSQKILHAISGTTDSAPLYEANKSVLISKAWLGKCMGEIGGETPYKNDGSRKTVEDIEPTDAHTKFEGGGEKNNIELVDECRQDLQSIFDQVWTVTKEDRDTDKWRFNIYSTNALNRISEGRFHLGFELERIRNEHNFGMETEEADEGN